MKRLVMAALFAVPSMAAAEANIDGYIALREAANAHAGAELAAHRSAWGMDAADRYVVDLAVGRIVWTFADGRTVTADAQLIGTWYDDTFLWGWAHPSAPPGTATAAAAVRAWGIENGITGLTVEQPVADLDESGIYAALATYLGDVDGVYAVEARPGTWAYIGFDAPREAPGS